MNFLRIGSVFLNSYLRVNLISAKFELNYFAPWYLIYKGDYEGEGWGCSFANHRRLYIYGHSFNAIYQYPCIFYSVNTQRC